MAGLIDVHTHVVPHEFPDNPSPGVNTRWPCLCMRGADRGVIEIAGKAFRELDARSWRAERRIEDMDRDGIDTHVLSPMPELLSYWFSANDGLEMTRHVNGFIASMMSARPDRFQGLAMVPVQDVTLALNELARLRGDGFAGIEIGSNVNGTYLGDPRFDELWAECERLGLAVFVHALHPVGSDRLENFPDLVPFAGFPLDTGLSAMTLIRADVPARYPNLRLGFSHGGGALAPLACRLEQGWTISDGFNGTVRVSPLEAAGRFYYDSLVYDTDYLDYLARSIAIDRIFAGSDYPYAIEERNLRGFINRGRYCTEADVNRAARAFLGLPEPVVKS